MAAAKDAFPWQAFNGSVVLLAPLEDIYEGDTFTFGHISVQQWFVNRCASTNIGKLQMSRGAHNSRACLLLLECCLFVCWGGAVLLALTLGPRQNTPPRHRALSALHRPVAHRLPMDACVRMYVHESA